MCICPSRPSGVPACRRAVEGGPLGGPDGPPARPCPKPRAARQGMGWAGGTHDHARPKAADHETNARSALTVKRCWHTTSGRTHGHTLGARAAGVACGWVAARPHWRGRLCITPAATPPKGREAMRSHQARLARDWRSMCCSGALCKGRERLPVWWCGPRVARAGRSLAR